MAFGPDVGNLLDVIARRRMPHRIPNFEPYPVPQVVERIAGRALPPAPCDTREKCREHVSVMLDYLHTVQLDTFNIDLHGPDLPMRRETERSADERENYLTIRDLPTIHDRADYEQYHWPEPEQMHMTAADRMLLETAIEMIPDAMGVLVTRCGVFELINLIAGYENYCYLLADDPSLLDEMAERFGRINLGVLTDAAEYERVDIFHLGDDVACRHGLMVAPEWLRRWLFPWMKRYADLAHAHGKVLTFHSDGDFSAVVEDIIAAGVDGKQAFEDISYPVTTFKQEYGDRIAALGGIDMDKLVRLPEDELRRYVRGVIEVCAPGGGYTVGSGNCFAPYVPDSQYLAMLDEANKWSCG